MSANLVCTHSLGITVMPEWFQCEGIDAVLEWLQAAGATALATSPYLLEIAPSGEGECEPPADGDAGRVRPRDRALWGWHETWVRTAPSLVHDSARYKGLRYQPGARGALTLAHPRLIDEVIEAARKRGMVVYCRSWQPVRLGTGCSFRPQCEKTSAWDRTDCRIRIGATATPARSAPMSRRTARRCGRASVPASARCCDSIARRWTRRQVPAGRWSPRCFQRRCRVFRVLIGPRWQTLPMVPVIAFVHSYGAPADVHQRTAIARSADGDAAGAMRLWVNRYGYLSQAKLDGLGRQMQDARIAA